MNNNLPSASTYHTGRTNGWDHGMRLKANLKKPTGFCRVCKASHS